MNLRRNRIEIINDILKSIQASRGKIKPTHLLYKSNLSYNKMREYLKELESKGFVKEEVNNKKKKVIITEKGCKYLEEFRRIQQFTESFGI